MPPESHTKDFRGAFLFYTAPIFLLSDDNINNAIASTSEAAHLHSSPLYP